MYFARLIRERLTAYIRDRLADKRRENRPVVHGVNTAMWLAAGGSGKRLERPGRKSCKMIIGAALCPCRHSGDNLVDIEPVWVNLCDCQPILKSAGEMAHERPVAFDGC